MDDHHLESPTTGAPEARYKYTPEQGATFSAEAARTSFEELYGPCRRGTMSVEHEDGTTTTVGSYELVIEPANRERQIVADFGVRAAIAGYREALGPVVLANTGFLEGRGDRPVSTIFFFLEAPASGPVASYSAAANSQGSTETVTDIRLGKGGPPERATLKVNTPRGAEASSPTDPLR